MSELSTADLAGRNAPRTPESNAPAGTPGTRDPKLNRDQDMTGGGVNDPALRDPTRRDPEMTSTSQHPSSLPNPAATDGANLHEAAPLFPTGEAEGFRARWTDVQTGFVDEPRSAVEQADTLVAEMMKRLAQVFAEERAQLEEQWSRGDDISTEDLRQALRRYRSFFDRLLQV